MEESAKGFWGTDEPDGMDYLNVEFKHYSQVEYENDMQILMGEEVTELKFDPHNSEDKDLTKDLSPPRARGQEIDEDWVPPTPRAEKKSGSGSASGSTSGSTSGSLSAAIEGASGSRARRGRPKGSGAGRPAPNAGRPHKYDVSASGPSGNPQPLPEKSLVIKPKQQKRTYTTVPESEKTAEYKLKREKNTASARLSRENKRKHDEWVKTRLAHVEELLSKAVAKNDALAKKLKSLKAQPKKAVKVSKDPARKALTKDVARLTSANTALTMDAARLTATNNALNNDVAHLARTNSALNSNVDRLTDEITALNKTIRRLTAGNNILKEQKAELTNEIADWKIKEMDWRGHEAQFVGLIKRLQHNEREWRAKQHNWDTERATLTLVKEMAEKPPN